MTQARTTTPLAHEVARRIRKLRADRGISLSELARGANLGKATLSAIEAGTRNATLETLYAIAARLDVPLAALLAPPTPADAPTVSGTAVTAELLEVFTDDGATTELYRLTIRPGPTQTSPAHPRGVVEYLTVFSGTALVGPADTPLTVAAGGHASFASDVPHIYAALDAEVHASLVIRHPSRRQG
ncbi:helix-turn-helix domain-containing protein [Actinospica sp. MGRD01-02]|uniref:Helix-turn-helix domain-containing protein n=1 Tax=Actinospica acidithermotolerans TaxID=2828514 RepID=A0A941IQA9_9ACTN|nr:XRE family transcriptional regulator [Actinospica acidithermotolerans]MBR7831236.1 helix-turn-helix domain-containing protein [Actinospica acidithermotolerans]